MTIAVLADVYCPCQGITLEAHQAVHTHRCGKRRQLLRELREPRSGLGQIHLATGVGWLREQLISVSVMANVIKVLGEQKGKSVSHAMWGRHVDNRTPEATGTSDKNMVHFIKYVLTSEPMTSSSGTTFASAPNANDASLLTQYTGSLPTRSTSLTKAR